MYTVECYQSGSSPYGISYGTWTINWWRWASSIPKLQNPVHDQSGIHAHVSQPEDVWLLAGRFGSTDNYFPKRRCSIPYGKSILLPVLNCQANFIENPGLKSEQALLDQVSADMQTIVRKDCYVNSQRVIPEQVQSDPRIFPLWISKDLTESGDGGDTLSTADGYWVFLKPLPKGEYNINFVGSCENGRLNSGADYVVDII